MIYEAICPSLSLSLSLVLFSFSLNPETQQLVIERPAAPKSNVTPSVLDGMVDFNSDCLGNSKLFFRGII